VALKHLGGRTLPAFLAGLAVFLWGVSFVMGGSFPMPDPRHGAFGLALAMHLAPLFMLSAIPWIGIVAWVLLRVRSTGLSAGALQEDAQ
jgi:hypothetical protein